MKKHDLRLFRELGTRLESTFSDWFGVPSYLVGMSETDLRPDYGSADSFFGLAGITLCRAFKENIRDRWRGEGACVLLDDSLFSEMYPNDWQDAETHFCSLAAHEFGHLVDSPVLFLPAATVHPNEPEWLREYVEQPSEYFKYSNPRSQRTYHGPQWIRSTIHVGDRMQRAGYPIQWSMAIDRGLYGLTTAQTYVDLLGDELQALATVPLVDIKNHAIPQPFLDQWATDCDRWPDV